MKIKTKSANPECKERLRRVLSYREKARNEAAGADDGTVRFAAESHAREANRLLLGIKDEISRDAANVGRQLQQTLGGQQRLAEKAAAGQISPRKANRQNRRLAPRIDRIREELTELNRCLGAEASEEVGGFADMPLESYMSAIVKPKPRLPITPSPAGFVLWIGLVALAVLASLHYLGYFEIVPPVVMEVADVDAGGGVVTVMCRNDSDNSILLYVPWTDPVTARAPGARRSKRYGMAVYVREKDSREFRLVPVSVSAWTYQGRAIQESAPIEIAPHLYVNLALDKSSALAGTDPQSMRIVLLDAAGKPVTEHEIRLSR